VNFSIIPIFEGSKAKIYTIKFLESDNSEYKNFVQEFKNIYSESVHILNQKLKSFSYKRGIIDEFLTRESSEAFNVYKISETNDNLRLYCIRYSNVALIIGGGGIKTLGKIKLKDNPHLQIKVDQLVEIEKIIQKRINSREIIITDNSIEGNLNFYGEG